MREAPRAQPALLAVSSRDVELHPAAELTDATCDVSCSVVAESQSKTLRAM